MKKRCDCVYRNAFVCVQEKKKKKKMEISAVGPPAVLCASILVAMVLSTVDVCRAAVPERSRIPVGRRTMHLCIFGPPILYGVSGYFFWMAGADSDGVYIAYFCLLGAACLLRACVPRIEQRRGASAGRWACIAAFLVVYGTLALSIPWAINEYAVSIAPHCGAVLLLAVYDLPLYVLASPAVAAGGAARPLLDPVGIKA